MVVCDVMKVIKRSVFGRVHPPIAKMILHPSKSGIHNSLTIQCFSFSQGATLVSGGLDALETLGRKTVNVITEGDPGWFFHSKR